MIRNNFNNTLLIFTVIEEGISVKICWNSANVQDPKTELIKSAYCTLLDIPHASKIPESGKILYISLV